MNRYGTNPDFNFRIPNVDQPVEILKDIEVLNFFHIGLVGVLTLVFTGPVICIIAISLCFKAAKKYNQAVQMGNSPLLSPRAISWSRKLPPAIASTYLPLSYSLPKIRKEYRR